LKMITQKEIKDLFDYSGGRLVYRNHSRNNSITEGKAAGGVSNKYGHIRVHINYKSYLLSKLIWLWHYGTMPDKIYFIDGVDYHVENLTIERKKRQVIPKKKSCIPKEQPIKKALTLINRGNICKRKNPFKICKKYEPQYMVTLVPCCKEGEGFE